MFPVLICMRCMQKWVWTLQKHWASFIISNRKKKNNLDSFCSMSSLSPLSVRSYLQPRCVSKSSTWCLQITLEKEECSPLVSHSQPITATSLSPSFSHFPSIYYSAFKLLLCFPSQHRPSSILTDETGERVPPPVRKWPKRHLCPAFMATSVHRHARKEGSSMTQPTAASKGASREKNLSSYSHEFFGNTPPQFGLRRFCAVVQHDWGYTYTPTQGWFGNTTQN